MTPYFINLHAFIIVNALCMFVEIDMLTTFPTLRDSDAASRYFSFSLSIKHGTQALGMLSEGKALHFNEMKQICKVNILIIIS